jgi:hypothetical protein
MAAHVVEGGGQVAGVPGEDRVGDDLEAEGVASVVVFVGGELLALAERDKTRIVCLSVCLSATGGAKRPEADRVPSDEDGAVSAER